MTDDPCAGAPDGGRAPRRLGSGLRLRRGRSLLADAQRRYRAADAADAPNPPAAADTPAAAPPPDPAPAPPAPPAPDAPDAVLTPLTERARALYEGGVVPVRALARLCGVSLRTLYNHVQRQGWQRRRPAVPRDPVRAARLRARRQAERAARAPVRRGLQARDPQAHDAALAAAERAALRAAAALAQAIARQDAEARTRVLAVLTRALFALTRGERPAREADARAPGKPRRRAKAQRWRPMHVTPLPCASWPKPGG